LRIEWTRRLIRPVDAPPLNTIRSLAYFLPVIEATVSRVNVAWLGLLNVMFRERAYPQFLPVILTCVTGKTACNTAFYSL